MDSSLRTQLSSAEDHFVSAMAEGPHAIEAFLRSWSTLQTTFDDALQKQLVSDELVALAHQVATRIETVAELLLELHQETEIVTVALQSDLDHILGDLSLDDATVTITPSSSRHVEGKPPGKSALPPYIAPAFHWLLDNLHDPYPSKSAKSSIVKESGSLLKDVENWFIDVRRRIGWNALRRKAFSNQRCLIVKAARQCLCNSPVSENESPSSFYVEFENIANRARCLYPDGSQQSQVAISGPASQPKSSRKRSLKQAYPSPEPSPEPSTQSSPIITTLPLPSPTSCRKRQRSDSLCSESSSEGRSEKRSRFDVMPPVHQLPSPATSSDCDDLWLEDTCRAAPTSNSTSSIHPPTGYLEKRKRRLSDCDQYRPAKRSHMVPYTHQPQAVSVSYPLPSMSIQPPFDVNLLESFFPTQDLSDGPPSPVSAEVLEELVPVEVNCYQYDFSPYQSEVNLPLDSPQASEAETLAEDALLKSDASPYIFTAESQQTGVDEFCNIAGFPFMLDYNPLQIPFTDACVFPTLDETLATQLSIPEMTVQPTISMPQWPSMSYLGGDSTDFTTSMPPFTKPSVLGDFNSNLRPVRGPYLTNDKLAKRERVERLREELRLLEADIA